MATKYKAPAMQRAYQYANGKLVDSAISRYNPGSAGDAETQRQWHLKMLGDIGKVWNDFTGKGVHVGVYDSGTQKVHWDLDRNYDASREVTIGGVQIDGNAGSDAHGTAVAGIIAAERNGRGGLGVAYDANVTGVAILRPEGSPIDINRNGAAYLDAFRQAASLFDVTNNSYGSNAAAIPVTKNLSRATEGSFANAVSDVMAYVAANGRGGLGTSTVWAAGNSATDGQSIGQNTDRHGIAVAAYRGPDGAASYYSNHGAHILVAAPSSDYRILGGTEQVTTDLLGAQGYNFAGEASDYTDGFGGTSGAAPVVTGVISLMLDANENLGWRDVKDILAASAKMPIAFNTGQVVVDADLGAGRQSFRLNESSFHLNGKDAGWNGGRMHFSNDYGYGAVDAYTAVRMAEVWGLFGAAKTSANEAHATVQADVNRTVSASFADVAPLGLQMFGDFINKPASVTFELGENIDVEHIDLSLSFDSITKVAFVEVPESVEKVRMGLMGAQFKLIAPDGTEGFISARGGLDSSRTDQNSTDEFTFGFSGFRGVESKGKWTLEFSTHGDVQSIWNIIPINLAAELLVKSLKLDVYGSVPTNDDVYTYTNEFFDMAAIRGEGGRKVLNDTDDGTDWINAAAVSSDVNLSLVGGQATTFGGERAFSLGRSTLIEGAVTGDGNDTLVGNRYDNLLFAMRGNDVLNGGAGNDTLFGGQGRDTFTFDNKGASGKDTVLDWSGGDYLATQTQLRGQGADGTVTVAKNAMLLLDGLLTGDTVTLSQNGGSVLKFAGMSGGYYLYEYVSGADLNSNDVIREVSFQPERTAAGSVGEVASSDMAAVSTSTDIGAAFAFANDDHGSFYLYDTMAGSMSGGVLLTA